MLTSLLWVSLISIPDTDLGRSKAKYQVKENFRLTFKPASERGKFADVDKPKQQPMVTESNDKLTALKNFRKRNGLCFKCGNKWSKDHNALHKCLSM